MWNSIRDLFSPGDASGIVPLIGSPPKAGAPRVLNEGWGGRPDPGRAPSRSGARNAEREVR